MPRIDDEQGQQDTDKTKDITDLPYEVTAAAGGATHD